jgi:hypothetical protein
MIANLRRVAGKESILFKLAEAAVDHPDETVRRALYPVVAEGTLHDLVREAKANEAAFRRRVRTRSPSSWDQRLETTRGYTRPRGPTGSAPSTACQPIADLPSSFPRPLIPVYGGFPAYSGRTPRKLLKKSPAVQLPWASFSLRRRSASSRAGI